MNRSLSLKPVTKMFRLQTLEGIDVQRGMIELNPAFLSLYGTLLTGYKPPAELEVNECSRMDITLSGGMKSATYVIVRVQ
jgi:hypothetical protein